MFFQGLCKSVTSGFSLDTPLTFVTKLFGDNLNILPRKK